MEITMKKLFHRFLIGLFFALPIVGLALFLTQISADAQESSQDPQPTTTPSATQLTYNSCVACHEDILTTWQHGPHGQALNDPIFAAAWSTQGEPGACLVCHTTGYDPATGSFDAEGVACEACHSPMPNNHPTDNMPVDNTTELCGKCHSDSRFSDESFVTSTHYQRDMKCTVCHDQHSAGMKTIEGLETQSEDASDLCANCHKSAMQNFPTSKHAEAGVTCVNCHLGFKVSDEDNADVHRAPDHNFIPSLDTCNKCHANQMHAPGDAVVSAAIKVEEIGGTATPEPTAAVTPVPPVVNQPLPVSPLGFAAMAGLLGLAAGMVLAPWLERSYKHLTKGGKND
jgi:predicted CXXCH cytochrome family protein